MQTLPVQIVYDLSALPAWAQSLATDLVAFLNTSWPVLVDGSAPAREIELQWATYGGFTQAKATIVRDIMLPFFKNRYTLVQATPCPFRNDPAAKTNTTRFTLIFEV